MYNRYAKEVKKITDEREKQYQKEPIRTEILERWRKLGFTNSLPQDCNIEFQLASSFEMMAQFILKLMKEGVYVGKWETSLFPLLRRALVTFWYKHEKSCRPIEPEEVISFLKEKNVGDLLWYAASRDAKNNTRYKRQTLEEIINIIRRYCEVNGFIGSSLFDAYDTLRLSEDGKKFSEIFLSSEPREATYLSYVADYFSYELYQFDRLYNNRKKKVNKK